MKTFENPKDIIARREREIGHKIKYSRREFLAQGVYAFAASLTLPSLPALIAKAAFAADCGGNQIAGGLPFMCFDMAGGAALAGNFLVGKQGGPDDWLSSYSTLGWNPRGNDKIDRRFGLPMAANASGLFQGLIATMSPEAQARFRMASVCHFSPLDTGDGKQNLAAYANAFGPANAVFKDGLSSQNSASGGNSASARLDRSVRPVFVSDFDSMVTGLQFGGRPFASLTSNQLAALSRATKSLTAEQVDSISTGTGSRILKEKVECYVNETEEFDVANIDPRKNQAAAALFGITPNTRPNDGKVIQAALATMTINGLSSSGVWTLGGCDYHDGTSTTGDAKDRQMGEMIGRCVEYAHRVQKPFFFQLISDGSCSANSGTRNWTSDTNEGMQIFGYYRPQGAPEYLRSNMQIGHFTDAQGAERTTVVGADPTKAALAVLANYCHIQGKIDQFKEFSRAFSDRELESILVFGQG